MKLTPEQLAQFDRDGYGLSVPSNGLLYPPASVEDIPFVTRPIEEGGVLERKGMVEVISSLEANGRKIPYDIRMGVWVTVEAETDYIIHPGLSGASRNGNAVRAGHEAGRLTATSFLVGDGASQPCINFY